MVRFLRLFLADYRSALAEFSRLDTGSGTSNNLVANLAKSSSLFTRSKASALFVVPRCKRDFLKPRENSALSVDFFRRLYAGFDAINLLPSPFPGPHPRALFAPASASGHEKLESTRAFDKTNERGRESRAELLTCRDPYTSFRDSDRRHDHEQTAPSRPDVIHLPRAGWLAG